MDAEAGRRAAPLAAGLDLPCYQGSSLNDVLPAIGVALGVPRDPGAAADRPAGGLTESAYLPPSDYAAPNVTPVQSTSDGRCADLVLEPVRRACLFLIDGMGSELIAAHPDSAPYLSSLLAAEGGRGHTLTAGFPSTTATSLSSIGTGLTPGAHGMLSYRLAVPGSGKLMNFLKWDQDVDPFVWQAKETMWERFARSGLAVTHVTSPRFADSGLTRSVFRGARFAGAEPPHQRAADALDALEAGGSGLVYLYHSDLDFVGHTAGVASPAWLDQLRYVDSLVQWLAERLPRDSALYVVADHGMVNVPQEHRIDVDNDPELCAGVALLGGEARARHVYAQPGAARDVLAIWAERLDGLAEVRSRRAAIEEGWFGPRVDPGFAERIGDVVVAMSSDWAITATEREAVDARQIGMHGSMTAAEQLVPFLEVRR
jgi:hypothetical protein